MTHYKVFDTITGEYTKTERFLCTYDALDWIEANYTQGQWDLFELHEFQDLTDEPTIIIVHPIQTGVKTQYCPELS